MTLVEVFEIKNYMVIWRQAEVRDFNGTDVTIRAMVRCSGEQADDFSMDIIFTDDASVPDPIIDEEQKKGFMFLNTNNILPFVDMLRNEKPIYGHLRGDRPEWTSVTTSQEPVGEGEEKGN